MRFAASQSIVCVRPVGHWFATSATSSSFPTEPAAPTGHRPPPTFASGFILSRASRLYRVHCSFARLSACAFRHLPWGCVSLFATSTGGVWVMGFHAHHGSVHDVSHVFDGPPPASWVCFAPQPRTGFTLQGVSLPHSRFISSMKRAFSSLAPLRCRRFPVGATKLRLALKALLRA